MKINFRKIQISIVALLMFAVIGCQENSNVKVIKLGHGLNVEHPVHEGMVYMAERVKAKSGGKIRIDIYPNQQLGSERELIELLQIGSLGITKVSTGALENFAPPYRVLGLPFLFDNREHRFKVLEGEIGRYFLDSSIDQRLKGLTFYDAGSRSFYSKQPIYNPEDLAGLKFRVMESATAIRMVQLMGGSPTPIAWGELYTALQQGIVDGAENNLPSFYLSRHYEICKYYTMDEHTALPDVLLIGTPVWNKLNEQEQQWLKEAAMESSEYQKKLWREAELEALEEIKEAGVEIIKVDKEEFREEVQPLYDAFKENTEVRELIEAIQTIK